MQAMSLAAPGGIDQLSLVDVEPRSPQSHEIQVAIKSNNSPKAFIFREITVSI